MALEVSDIKTFEDIEIYIEGCMNDYESGISDKEETILYLKNLVVGIQLKINKGNINS